MKMNMSACLEGEVISIVDLSKIGSSIVESKHTGTPKGGTEGIILILLRTILNPEDLIGRSFLMEKQEDGQHSRDNF
jgi:hypothetical protein